MGLVSVKVRSGMEANRTKVTPAIGEWLYARDSKRAYMGDGETPGGISIITKHFNVETDAAVANLDFCRDGDTADVAANGNIYFRVNGQWIKIFPTAAVDPTSGAPEFEWVMPTLNSKWHQYGNGLSPVRYAKWGQLVVIEGGCYPDSGDGVIFTLPPGFRPEYEISIPVYTQRNVKRVEIKPNGEVEFISNRNVRWISLNLQFTIPGANNG